jgi:hypothetical protein|tara:strand:+ start:173 stop:571 length:399 start_codon:yes stop_codon:yes gene_type:complete
MEWILFILVFIFGYVTCRTFYFVKALRTSAGMVRCAQLISLAILAKSMEHYIFAQTKKAIALRESGESEHNIGVSQFTFDDEIRKYKERSIKNIIDYHPDLFKTILDFDDWKSGMEFLERHHDLAQSFFSEK